MSGSLILVTGGTGYIGRHVVKTLLENGENVRATVRSADKGVALKALFPENSSRLTTIIVENHEIPTAYDEAVQGVEIVIHMASPLVPPHAFDNEKDILIPARDGAVNILKSASKSPSVKRVVFTSSSTAVTNNDIPRSESIVWTESDWNPKTWEDGVKGQGGVAYAVSKTVAEHAAWDFMDKNKPHFDLISLNAPGVFGAPVQRPKSLSEIEGSTKILLSVIDPNAKVIPYTWTPFYIDVRDMALAHYKAALATPEAGNQRYLLAGPQVATNKLIREYIVKHYPSRKVASLSPEAAAEDPKVRYDSSKAQKTFNIKFRSLDEMLKDFMDFVESYSH